MRLDIQFSIFLINMPGVLASVTGALAKARINMLALTLMDTGEHGVLRIVTDDADTTRKVLGSAHDRWTETEVLVLDMDNRPGSFSHAAQKLADEHVNITYAYCSAGGTGGRTTAVFKIVDLKKAMKVLGAGREDHDEGKGTVKTAPGRR